MNIGQFLKNNRVSIMYIAGGAVAALVAIAAIYFGGNLYQGSLQGQLELSETNNLQETVQPQVQTVLQSSAPELTCSGTPDPATLGATVQWTMNADEISEYLEEEGHLGISEYLWEVDGQEVEGESIEITYNEPMTSASVTPKIIYLAANEDYEEIAGQPCNITFQNPVVSCSGSPDPAETGTPVTWTMTIQNELGGTLDVYEWNGNNQEFAEGKTTQITYPEGQTSATMTPAYIWQKDSNSSPVEFTGSACTVDLFDEEVTEQEEEQQQENEEEQEETSTEPLPAEDVMNCALNAETVVQDSDNNVEASCQLSKAALVEAHIVAGSFDPVQPPSENSIITTVLEPSPKQANPFVLTWDAKLNKYDQPVTPGGYTFVISAKPTENHLPDYSLLSFTIIETEPEPQPTETEQIQQTQTTQETQQIQQQTQAAPQPSQCPGLNYPSDIVGHWAEAIIKSSYDSCLIEGYQDGTFRPDQQITRAEAVKTVLSLAEIAPHEGCYTANCGAGHPDNLFNDITAMWQGPWIRAAWDEGIVEGLGPNEFGPQFAITRAEATALVARAFNVPAHQGCYTANCGAGHPDNLFNDITAMWQGQWIRVAWDMGWIKGTGQNQFEPNRPITRAELLKVARLAVATR